MSRRILIHRIARGAKRSADPLLDNWVVEGAVEHLLDRTVCFDGPGKQVSDMLSCRADHFRAEEFPGFLVSVDI